MTNEIEIPNLYTYLGITEDRFETKIKPLMNDIAAKNQKVDLSLLRIEQSDLSSIEKMYCSYAIGRVIGMNEVASKAKGILKKITGRG